MDEPKSFIFESTIGSHIWKMNTPVSDIDIFRIYMANPRDILLHKPIQAKFIPNTDMDITYHEISEVTNQLIKSNINFIIGVFSPIIEKQIPKFGEYKYFARKVITSQMFHSVHGMALSNYKKYGEDMPEARYNKILRTVDFCINFMSRRSFAFEPFTGGNKQVFEDKIRILEDMYENFGGFDKPDPIDIKNLEDVVVEMRMLDIYGELY